MNIWKTGSLKNVASLIFPLKFFYRVSTIKPPGSLLILDFRFHKKGDGRFRRVEGVLLEGGAV